MGAADKLRVVVREGQPLTDAQFAALSQHGRRAHMGYRTPIQRSDNCRGCKFCCVEVVDPDSAFEREALRCDPGAFAVAASGKCSHWESAS